MAGIWRSPAPSTIKLAIFLEMSMRRTMLLEAQDIQRPQNNFVWPMTAFMPAGFSEVPGEANSANS